MKENKAVALGEDFEIEMDRVDEDEPVTIEERVVFLEHVVKTHTASLDSLYAIVKEIRSVTVNPEQLDKKIDESKKHNRDEVPPGTVLKGVTNKTPFWCVVKPDGFYVGIQRYDSLSAAAAAVSGVRRSGWTFWRFDRGKYEGKTVKEVYRGQA